MNTTEARESGLAQVAAERDALRAEVERLRESERSRQEKAQQQAKTRQERIRLREREREEREGQERARLEEVERIDVPRSSILIDARQNVSLAARTLDLDDPKEMYLDLLKNCLTRLSFGEQAPIDPLTSLPMSFDRQRRIEGSDWPLAAETMAGLLRLDNVQHCVVDVLRHQVPGDLVETGVWRGGITILMRAILKAYGDADRVVWAADSFAGLPVPDAGRFAADSGWNFSTAAGYDILAIPVEEVRANFTRYGLLDDRVRFLVGWFRDTLPVAPIERISVLRLDGDLYESTMDALNALYPKLSVGGYLIVDDYLSWEPCKLAVDEYRAAHGITEPIHGIDWTGAYWQRER